MEKQDVYMLYRNFGNLIRQHRERQPEMTQEKLGNLVGLSRTSITNIEKGRQHVALHQVLALANALGVRPEALLPRLTGGADPSWVSEKLPPDTEKDIAEWAKNLDT